MAADGQLPAFYLQEPEMTDEQKMKESRRIIESPFGHTRAHIETHTERYFRLREKLLKAEADRQLASVLPNGYRPETLWLKNHVDRNEQARKELEALKDTCEIELARAAGIVTLELTSVARAVDPSLAAGIVAAAQDRAVRASAAAAANTADTGLAALKAAADQEVSELTTGGHVVAHAVTAARTQVEAACMGQGDMALRDRLVAAAEENRVKLGARSTSVFDDKIFSLITDIYVLLTQAAFGSDVSKCLAAKFAVATVGITKSKEAAMLLCTPQAIEAARSSATQLRQVEASEKAAKVVKAGKGDKSDKRLVKPASATPRAPAYAPGGTPPPAATTRAPARHAAESGGGSRGGGSRTHHRESAPRRRRDHSPDSDDRGRRSRSRP